MNIEMPKLFDTMTEGIIVEWSKQIGDKIKTGDVLAEIETDKAIMEVEASADGVLAEILVQAGETSPVGAPICVLH